MDVGVKTDVVTVNPSIITERSVAFSRPGLSNMVGSRCVWSRHWACGQSWSELCLWRKCTLISKPSCAKKDGGLIHYLSLIIC